MRFAAKRCNSGWTVRSFVATMYQLRFDFHAVPGAFLVNNSAAGAKLVPASSKRARQQLRYEKRCRKLETYLGNFARFRRRPERALQCIPVQSLAHLLLRL